MYVGWQRAVTNDARVARTCPALEDVAYLISDAGLQPDTSDLAPRSLHKGERGTDVPCRAHLADRSDRSASKRCRMPLTSSTRAT